MEVYYRKPEISDIGDIAEIYIDCFSKSPYNKYLKKEDIIEEIKNDILEEDIYYVAEFNKKIIGISSGSFFSFLGEKKIRGKSLFVLTKYQSNGIGAKLFFLLIEDGKKGGAIKIEGTAHIEAPAFNFHLKNGRIKTGFSLIELKI